MSTLISRANFLALFLAFPLTFAVAKSSSQGATEGSQATSPDISTLKAKIAGIHDLACAPDADSKDAVAANLQTLVRYENHLLQALDDKIKKLDSRKDLDAESKDFVLAGWRKERDDLQKLVDQNKVCDYLPSAPVTVQVTSQPDVAQSMLGREAPDLDTLVTISPSELDFDDLEVGATQEETLTITPSAGASGVHLAPPRVIGCRYDKCAFRVKTADKNCSDALGQAPCEYTVAFAPFHDGDSYNQEQLELKGSDGSQHWVTHDVPLSGTAHVSGVASLDSDGSGASTPSARAVVGYDLSSASATDTQGNPFLEFDVNVPLGRANKYCVMNTDTGPKNDQTDKKCTMHDENGKIVEDPNRHSELRTDPLNRRWWGYLNPRITSVAQPTNFADLLANTTDFLNNPKANLALGLDVQGGLEFVFLKPRNGLPFFSSYQHFHPRIAAALVAGGGIAAPFSAPGGSPQVFMLAPNSPLRAQFNIPTPPMGMQSPFTNIAFVTPDRSRFFRKYYFGLRLKSYHFSGHATGGCDDDEPQPCEAVLNSFPGIIDLTTGQDEQVTGGHLSRWVLRIDAVYPLPYVSGFTIFGSVSSAFQKNVVSAPFVAPPPGTVTADDPSVFLAQIPQPNHDIYRIGLGVDLLQFITARMHPVSDKQGIASTPPNTGGGEKLVH